MKNVIINNVSKSIEKQLFVAFSASVLLAISAKVAIPLGPVPFTLQTMTVTFLTILLGKRLGLATIALYLTEGLLGFPVFSNMSGASIAYIIGFFGSVLLTDFIYNKWNCKTITSLFLLSLVSVVPTFLLGVIVLASFLGIKSAYLVGVAPFIFSEVAKCFVLALFLHKFLSRK